MSVSLVNQIRYDMNTITLSLALLFCSVAAVAQDNESREELQTRPFIGLELGQAVFNDFNSYSGEVGMRFKNNQSFRISHMNIKMSEEHLSSDFAIIVDGDDVEGEQFGFEAFYDFPVIWEGLYISPSVGWYRNGYHHIVLDEGFKKSSVTIGTAINFREVNVFGIKGLYYTLSFPMRTPFRPIDRTKLGDTIIKSNRFDCNIFFFVGYMF